MTYADAAPAILKASRAVTSSARDAKTVRARDAIALVGMNLARVRVDYLQQTEAASDAAELSASWGALKGVCPGDVTAAG